MSVARGKTRRILERVGRIQHLVGAALAVAHNDRDPMRMDHLIPLLQEAHVECLAITAMYDPVPTRGGEQP